MGRLILVTGRSGTGKTTLANDLKSVYPHARFIDTGGRFDTLGYAFNMAQFEDVVVTHVSDDIEIVHIHKAG